MATGDTLQGRRLPDGFHYFDSEAGDYWRQPMLTTEEFEALDALDSELRGSQWEWTVKDPLGQLGTIAKHGVKEHEDGAVTVSPSILNVGEHGYHGWLEHGVWREA